VQREAEHKEGAERKFADGVRGSDGQSLAEVVQANSDRDQQRELKKVTGAGRASRR